MSIVFTDHAVERMRERDVTQHDVGSLLAVMEQVTIDPKALEALGKLVRLEREDDIFYIIRSGSLRAVLTSDRQHPDRLVVASVYQALT